MDRVYLAFLGFPSWEMSRDRELTRIRDSANQLETRRKFVLKMSLELSSIGPGSDSWGYTDPKCEMCKSYNPL